MRQLDRGRNYTAIAAQLPLYTRNTEDFRGVEHLVEVVGEEIRRLLFER